MVLTEKDREVQGSHSKRHKNEIHNENIASKGQPSWIAPTSGSSTTPSRMKIRSPRKEVGRSSTIVREPAPKQELFSTNLRRPQTSLKGIPGSRTSDKSPPKSSPATFSRATNKQTKQSLQSPRSTVRGMAGTIEHRSIKVPTKREDDFRTPEQPTMKFNAATSSSDGDSDKENKPFPKTQSFHTDSVRNTNPITKPTAVANDKLQLILRNMRGSSTPRPRSVEREHSVSDNDSTSGFPVGDSTFHADGELSEDDIEYNVEAFLDRREHYRRIRRPEVKSVKWDPAIVDFGPLAAITNKPKAETNNPKVDINKPMADTYRPSKAPGEQQIDLPTKGLQHSLLELAQMATELMKEDRQKLQKILEAMKCAESGDDSVVITRPKKDRKPLEEIKFHDKTTGRSAVSKQNEINKESTSPAKKLNPAAPVYRKLADIKARISPKKENTPNPVQFPLHVQRKRRHAASEETIERPFVGRPNKYIPPALRVLDSNVPADSPAKQQEPIWIDTSKLAADGKGLPQISSMLNDWLQSTPEALGFGTQFPEEVHDQQTAPVDTQIEFQSQSLPPVPPAWIPLPSINTSALPQSWCHMPLPEWCPISFVPVSMMPLPQMPLPQMPLPQMPLPQVPLTSYSQVPPLEKKTKPFPRRIPNQSEHGRTAETLHPAWASSLLDKFMEKYPMTGRLIPPAAPSPLPKRARRGKNASEIQQKLEELLLYQKEKRIFEQRHNTTNMSEDSDSSSGRS
ncbi:hypothetical protein MBM_04637 [Drepanopeziza brunnea f. sp. 'multigermtubi' MB_m1]|uniref:Uncharacterized protein n=1 Tax=Marssonina brunnea f. sp. multigermtubi (strain MB_m1) TaxID=1072389 RepID=K1WHJ9_MARBU|nr:uncharacterized protein MBM_04637 [Drepanopeziza brunnea f. sp. 'multigermtubi' MB_m1]EKD17060.1 hypothetical protein MBM_04637 [Drepanopeziza brunnea f. sp. 'multigermtubi' MB_m1]